MPTIAGVLAFPQQFWQLCDIRRNPPRRRFSEIQG
jgi:hypothetical protein